MRKIEACLYANINYLVTRSKLMMTEKKGEKKYRHIIYLVSGDGL